MVSKHRFITTGAIPHGRAQIEGGSDLPVTVRTSAKPWSYAISFEFQATAADVPMGIRIELVVHSGRVGVGCLDHAKSGFLDEQLVDAAGATVAHLVAARAAEIGSVIVRNASSHGASRASILRIDCFEIHERPDAVRPPLLSQPSVTPGWSRFYGTPGESVEERLRVKRFDTLRGPGRVQWSDGLSLGILPGDQLSRAVYVSGTYEPNTLVVLRALLGEGDVFFDVGANAGAISLPASIWVGSTGAVFSFEPSVREFRRLTGNLRNSGVTNVAPVAAAIAEHTGSARLRVADASCGGLNTLGDRFPYEGVVLAETRTVETVTLDEFCARSGTEPAVLKLDVEGSEGAALASARQLLLRSRPAVVLEVFETSLASMGWTITRLEALLAELRYSLFTIDDGTARLERLERLRDADEQNIVALPAERIDEFARRRPDLFGCLERRS